MRALRDKLTYANVIATVALFVALGGSSYAALTLPQNSVDAKQIKRGAVGKSRFGLARAVSRDSERRGWRR